MTALMVAGGLYLTASILAAAAIVWTFRR